MKSILLIGKNGQVGYELQHVLAALGNVVALDRAQLDLTNTDAIRATMRRVSPQIVVNAAGYTIVDKAQSEPELAMQVNAAAPGVMGEEAKRIGALLVHYSTDYVFDGTRATPYLEDDSAHPVNAYGESKLEGEKAIVATGCKHLILRTSWIYSARGSNFVRTMLRLAREKKEISVVNDQIGSPTAARELAKATVQVLEKFDPAARQNGIYHLSAEGYTSRYEFAKQIIETAKALTGETAGWATIRATTTANFPLPAARPLNVMTSKDKIKAVFGLAMPSWQLQLQNNLKQLVQQA